MPWIVWTLLIVIALVLAFALGWYLSAVGLTDDGAWGNPRAFDEQQWPVHMQRRLVEVMPYAMLVLTGQGLVRYLSPDAGKLGIVEHDRLSPTELMDMLEQVVADGRQREREIHIKRSPLPGTAVGSDDDQNLHRTVEFVKVRIGVVDEDAYVMFISDVTEQRRFASVRRDFVTNVSHELKTPAGAISLLAETIADAADDPDAVRYFAGRMSVESQRLTQLVYRLIDLQRVERLGTVKELAPVSVVAVCREAIGQNLTQAQARHIALHLVNAKSRIPLDDPAQRGPWAKADQEALTTAVKNLVENAIRYSPEHAVVNVDVQTQNNKVLIRVIDCGIGIPKADLGRIFERFYRVDAARSRDTGGSGLGLAIAKHCVEECSGTLNVWSHEHLGSTFTITLSSAQPPVADVHARGDVGAREIRTSIEQRDEVADDANPDR